jgi:hypothetical protein
MGVMTLIALILLVAGGDGDATSALFAARQHSGRVPC